MREVGLSMWSVLVGFLLGFVGGKLMWRAGYREGVRQGYKLCMKDTAKHLEGLKVWD